MWNCIQIIRRWLPPSSGRRRSAARLVTTFLCLAIFGSAAAVAAAAIGKTDAKSAPALTNSTKRIQPNKPDTAHGTAAGNPLWAIPITVLAATRDRPLFAATRRPPAPPVFNLAAAEPPRARPPIEPERPPLVLIGTAAGTTTAIAVLLDQKTNRTVHLRLGQSQYGWMLGAVRKREVVLQKDHAIVYLPLSPAAPATAAPALAAETRLDRRQR
jgi:hypothetical protein